MSPPASFGNQQRIMALLTAVDARDVPAIRELAREFTLEDAVVMAGGYAMALRRLAVALNLPAEAGLQRLALHIARTEDQ